MKVIILGADGYLGWPTMMYFAARGHEVLGIDNFYKRKAALSVKEEPLIPVERFIERAKLWNELTSNDANVTPMNTMVADLDNYWHIGSIFKEFQPDVVVHYAEQPSGPYSMISYLKAAETLKNNLIGTLNLAYAVKENCPDCHIVKIGTAGEYGTPNVDIPEGWLDLDINGRKDRRLFPREAGSLYHTSKIMDTDMLYFYIRSWGLTVTDLMQGPVYGIVTDEMGNPLNAKLHTTFNYGEIFGTVLNRFIVQAVAGYPLTVYGKGNQKRGYLNIMDTMQCVYVSAMNPPEKGTLRVMNQMTETFSVNELAERVVKTCNLMGFNPPIQLIENPRVEKEDHYYNIKHTQLESLGVKPHYLNATVIAEMLAIVQKYQKRINPDIIFKGVKWK